MKLWTLFWWFACIGLEGLLVARAIQEGWWRKIPFFFFYLASVLLQDLLLLFVYSESWGLTIPSTSGAYRAFYWGAQLMSLVLGCAVTWEVFRGVLSPYPTVGRMAGNVLILVLGAVFSTIATISWHSGVSLSTMAAAMERNLRAGQAVALVLLVLLVAYYRIPMGRAHKGVFFGYGIFVGSSVVELTGRIWLRSLFLRAWPALQILQPLFYVVALCAWCIFLWNYEDSRVCAPPRLETDYHSLVFETKKSFSRARSLLERSVRP